MASDEMASEDHLIPVQILGLHTDTPGGVAIVLKGDEPKVVPIVIGEFEAQALVMAIQKVEPPRPMPYDLLQDVLERMHGTIRQLVIHSVRDSVFHAYLLIESREKPVLLDCRPSDGLVMATRLGVPIYMTPEVLEEAGLEPEGP